MSPQLFNDGRYHLRPSLLLSGIISESASLKVFLVRSMLALQQESRPPIPLCWGSWSCCVRGRWGAVGGGAGGSCRRMAAGLQRRAEEIRENQQKAYHSEQIGQTGLKNIHRRVWMQIKGGRLKVSRLSRRRFIGCGWCDGREDSRLDPFSLPVTSDEEGLRQLLTACHLMMSGLLF